MYVLSTGTNNPGCGLSKPEDACNTFQYLMVEYHKVYNRTWLYLAVLHTDQSIVIDGSDSVDGIGKESNKDENTCFSIVIQENTKDMVSVRLQNLSILSATLTSKTANLDFENVMFNDSTVRTSNAHSLRFCNVAFKHQRRLNGIKANYVEEVVLDHCNFTDTNIEYNDTTESSMVNFRQVQNIRIEEVMFQNIAVSISESDMRKTKNLITVDNVEKCDMRNITIKNNKNVAGLQIRNTILCQVTTSMFQHNTIEHGNHTSFLSALHGSVVTVITSNFDIDNCTFEDNVGIKGGAIFATNRCLLRVQNNSYFKRNSALEGGALYITPSCSMYLNDTYFLSNSAVGGVDHKGYKSSAGGAIHIETRNCGSNVSNTDEDNHLFPTSKIKKDILSMKHSRISNNNASLIGGGIFVGCPKVINAIPSFFLHSSYGKNDPHCDSTSATIELDTVIFRNNYAYYGGGFASYSTSHILKSNFKKNHAYIGGGLFLYQGICHLKHTHFTENSADYCGSFLHGDGSKIQINHCSVQDYIRNSSSSNNTNMFGIVHQAILHNGMLNVTDFLVKIFLGGREPHEINVLASQIPYPYPDCECDESHNVHMRNTTITCPFDYYAVPKLSKNANCSNGTCTFASPFNFVCQRAPIGRYISGKGSYIVRRHGAKVFFTNDYPCPVPGANCTLVLKALPGYWCYITDELTITCPKCPPNACCTGSSTCLALDSCSPKKKGIMCSECIDGHEKPFFDNDCIPVEECKDGHSILTIIPLVLILGLGLAVTFGVTEEAVKIFKLFSTAAAKVHSAIHHPKGAKLNIKTNHHAQATDTDTPELDNLEEDRTQHPNDLHNDALSDPSTSGEEVASGLASKLQISASLPYLMLLTYMIQDMSLFHSSMYNCSNHSKPYEYVIDRLTMSNVFHFHIDILAKFNFFQNRCVDSVFGHKSSTLLKEFWKSSLYFLTYFVFLSLYLIFCVLIPRCQGCSKFKRYLNKINITLRIASGFLTIQLLIYQKLSSTAVKFINCIEINNSRLLHMDATYVCFKEHWQLASVLYLCFCIIPLPIFIMVGPSLLKKNVIDLLIFNISLVVPLVSPILCSIMYCGKRLVKPEEKVIALMREGANHTGKNNDNEDVDENAAIVTDAAGGSTAREVHVEPTAPPEYGTMFNQSNEERAQERKPLLGRNLESREDKGGGALLQETKDDDHQRENISKSQKEEEKKMDSQQSVTITDHVLTSLQQPFRKNKYGINWLGVVLAFRLILVFCSLLIHEVLLCSSVLLTICFVRFCTELIIKPYNSRWLNWFSIGTLSCIFLVSLCDFSLALLERSQYEECTSDKWMNLFAYVIDTFTVYIPALCLLVLGVYMLICVLFKFLKKIIKKCKQCNERK